MSQKPDELFQDFDFSLLGNADFKEDSVREELIQPLLKALGYTASGKSKIVRSKTLTHPLVTTGSGKERKITNFPDYLLQVEEQNAWVLDAKSPHEAITQGKNLEQVYFYAIHPDVRVNFYALCNGREFVLYEISSQTALLHFHLSEIKKHWEELKNQLSPSAFIKQAKTQPKESAKKADFDYMAIKPLGEIKNVEKQAAKRHFGVHGYFTKQAWKVVQEYIKNFTQPGDVVLDPYGGTGVTLIESLILGRNAIHIDINPLSAFMVKGLIEPVNIGELKDQSDKIEREFTKTAPTTEEQITETLKTYTYPKDISLMKNADVDSIEKLFTPFQLAQLAYLKHLIKKVKDKDIRHCLLLAFSSTITKTNLTYHPSSSRGDNAGDSAAFRYYRFRIAPHPVSLDVMSSFKTKLKKLINAKKEIAPLINKKTVETAAILKGTATNLSQIYSESIDYIYTDPPYGAKIPYLDLSVMWNAWLDLPVTKEDFKLEAIEGGELKKSKEHYAELIAQSIKEMYRVLKFDRWMSFVFSHKDPAYWHLIVDTAEKIGFEYAGAVAQNNGQSSFKKRQNPFTVLQGQLIINFKKVRNPVALAKYNLGADITDIIIQTVEGIIAKEHGATIEEINNELVIRGLEMGFLDLLSERYQDLTPFLNGFLDFDDATHKYHLRKNTKFRSNIPVELRVRYYTYSFLKRMSFQKQDATFDEIVFHIMPLLKNGITPENQTILAVLEEIADRVGEDRWRLKKEGQQQLFDTMLS
jgi:16S rRNA G966 N2-methylase RsmD